MYPISDLFKSFLKRRDSEMIVKAQVGDEQYDMNNIVDFAIESKLIGGEEFEIGTVVLSRLIMKLRLKGEVPVNARIVPYVAFDTTALTWEQADFAWDEADMPWAGGASEWMPLGEFYIDSRTRDDEIWRFECLDKLIWSEQPFVSALTYPATMQAVWDEICSQLGYAYDNTVQINSSYKITTEPKGYTCRQIMGYIAGANSASVRAGKAGQIQFKRFTAADSPDMELGASDYIKAKQTNEVKQYTRFVVMYDEEQGLEYEAGTGGEDQSLYLTNPFMTQSMVDDLAATLGGFAYQPMEMDARGYPHIDVGDVISYEVYEGSTWENTITAWQDTHIPWDGMVQYNSLILTMSMRYSGGFKMMLDAPSKSEQQSEYVVEGTLTKQVKQLNKDTVKLDRSYFGVTTSRENGLEIEREDGISKLTLNSDFMDWEVGGKKLLYLDAQAKRLKFKGTLEGADGIFSGTIQAGTIIGSTINGGNINGTLISGSTIVSPFITTGIGDPTGVELSSTNKWIRVKGPGNTSIEIEASPFLFNNPALKFNYEGYETTVFQFGDTFMIGANTNVNLNITGSQIRLDGNLRFNGGNTLGFSAVPIATTPEEAVGNLNYLISVLRGMKILA